jgi:hypothetical protein
MRRPFRRAGADSYKMPGIDTPRAKASALMFLTNARSIDGVTADRLAHAHRLKPLTAERMLADEQARRSRLC